MVLSHYLIISLSGPWFMRISCLLVSPPVTDCWLEKTVLLNRNILHLGNIRQNILRICCWKHWKKEEEKINQTVDLRNCAFEHLNILYLGNLRRDLKIHSGEKYYFLNTSIHSIMFTWENCSLEQKYLASRQHSSTFLEISSTFLEI